MLAEVLALLASDGRDWRLRICGEGHLEGELEAKLAELGVGERAELLGYVPFGEQLDRVYRSSHVLLHVSWTEGLPQILLEGFAAATPVVATDVGGVRDAVGDAALLIPAGRRGGRRGRRAQRGRRPRAARAAARRRATAMPSRIRPRPRRAWWPSSCAAPSG